MELDEFWSLVEGARADAAGGDAGAPASAVGEALEARLARLPSERIVEFHRCLGRVTARAHQWDLCAAAYVIWDYISDDGFGDFKAGLVGLGHDAFERVVAEPDALAEHPMVRGIAAGRVDRFALAGGAVADAAADAFEQVDEDPEAFWEALAARRADDDEKPATGGWSGRFGDPGDAALIPQRLPHLHALFSAPPTA